MFFQHRRIAPSVLIPLTLCLGLMSIPLRAFASAPSSAYDLKDWKITLPGPVEIRNLKDYSSKYFALTPAGEMAFHLDASEKGPTANTHFVRSELRHLPNWKATESHALSATVHVSSRLEPDKVTVLQIHGITEDKQNAPPLLRIAVDGGDLNAHIKSDPDGEHTDKILLIKGLGAKSANVEILVEGGQLRIKANGVEKVRRSLAFWPFWNYFKAGCYPQATKGTVDVFISHLQVR